MEFAELIRIPKLDGVILKSPHHDDVNGTLCITGHHLILSSRQEGVQELMLNPPEFFKHFLQWHGLRYTQRQIYGAEILHQNIDLVERKDNKPGPSGVAQGGFLILKCKDLRVVQLEIMSTPDLTKVAQSLESLCNLSDLRLLYPFFYKPMFTILEDGYKIFRPEIEYGKLLSTDEWRLSWVNRHYALCPTYPQVLVVPKHADDESLVASAAFRKGGRFPVLSYKHDNGAVLLRSSQPLLGPQNKRCKPDERLLNAFVGQNKRGFIFDLRSQALIAQHRTKGGGTENDSNYPQWRKVSRPMDKVSNLQLLESFTKLVDVCNDKDVSCDKWLSKLDGCGWLSHVLNALNTACTVAQCLEHEASPVLVHGSKGMDATLVVCSLVQIIINPDCRTVRGIQALIDREWLQAGHPFSTRHPHSCYYTAPGAGTAPTGLRKASFAPPTNTVGPGVSPTFLLFLDCVHQLQEQFPCSFEFTQDLLVILFEHSYFSQYGTFLGDCEKQREELDLYTQTTSLWSHLNTPQAVGTILSPLYEPNQGIIWPSVAPMSLVLWEELYLRWVIDFAEQRMALEQISRIREKDKELRSKAVKLRKQLSDLIREVRELEGDNHVEIPADLMLHRHDEHLQISPLDLEIEEKD